MDDERNRDTIHKITSVVNALRAGRLVVHSAWADELLAAPRGVTGLVDIANLSPGTVARARAAAVAHMGLEHVPRDEQPAPQALSNDDAQVELFRLYSVVFAALTGCAVEYVNSEEEIRQRMLSRVRESSSVFEATVQEAIDELAQFYQDHGTDLFAAARALGGAKTVLGGQRAFTETEQVAVRMSGLYLDTQLLPDPVFPFVAGELHLNAALLQLALVLYHVLPLRPLVEVRLPVPPIFLFPSFEQPLEEGDAETQAGIADLAFKVLGPLCDGKVSSIDEVFEYASSHGDALMPKLMESRLFIPPGADHRKTMGWEDAVAQFLSSTRGIRSQAVWEGMSRMPPAALLVTGVLERLTPQYHLLENADQLDAQPLLSQPVQWHYFELCAAATARELVNRKVLTQQAFSTLQAFQDDSLTWLANIPVVGLVELRRNQEHARLREELKKCTAQLSGAGPADLPEVVREVNHGLAVLIQSQQQALAEISNKYGDKAWAAAARAAVGGVSGAVMSFLPSLADLSGVTAPAAATVGALAAGGLTYASDKVAEMREKRRVQRTLIGMLAAARTQE